MVRRTVPFVIVILLFAVPHFAQASTLQWNTFLGSSTDDEGQGIAVDGSGNVYVCGTSFGVWGNPVRQYWGDTDAFVAKLNSAGVLVWSTFLGGSPADTGRGIAVDASGNVYVTGSSAGSWDSPVEPHAGGGTDDAFVAKLSSSGVVQWNTFLGSTSADAGNGIAVDANGNVYVTGNSEATWGHPGRTHRGGSDAFVAKLNGSGVLQWNTFLGSSSEDRGNAIALGGGGGVHVTGASQASWGIPVRVHAGGRDAFVAKVNSEGLLLWNTFLGSSGDDAGNGIAADVSGDVYVTGGSDAAWGSPLRGHEGGADAFVAKLNSAGVLEWNTFLGSPGGEEGYGIAVDTGGMIRVAGDSSATWGAPALAYAGGNDAFVAGLSGAGNLLWNTFLGSSRGDGGTGIAVDGGGYAYVTGGSDATWGSPVRLYVGGEDALAARLDDVGDVWWSTFLGGASDDAGAAIAADGGGNLYVTGYSKAGWGSPVRAYAGGHDAFVAKLNSAGVLQWNTFLGSADLDSGQGIAVDGSGGVYVTGSSSATWGSPLQPFVGHGDAFVAKLDGAAGVLQWNTFLGSANDNDYGVTIAVHGSGNLYVAGNSFAGWGSPVRAYAGGEDAFAAKLNNLGALLWNTFLGSSAGDNAYGLTVDGGGNVYVVGRSFCTPTVCWGSPVRSHAGVDDAYVVKLNDAGVLQWQTFLGSGGYDWGNSVAVDDSGNVYLSGYSKDTWGSPVRAYSGGDDAFLAKLSSEGVLLWNTFLGSDRFDNGRSIVLDGNGGLYVTGESAATWGSPTREHSGGLVDAYVARVDGAGALQWNTFLGSENYDYGLDIAMDGGGNVYVTGYSAATWGSPVREFSGGGYIGDAFVAKLGDLPGWRSGEADLGGGWRWTSWFGYYNMTYAPWVYHLEHRWLYPLDDGSGGVYFYYSDMGAFVWTNPTTYPYLYRFGTQAAWLWYLKGSANPRWFYNLTAGAWESLP